MTEFLSTPVGAIVSSACAALVVVVAVRQQWPGWALVSIACLPVVAVTFDADIRLISFHGFLHSGIAYRILADGIPPSDPLFAERALLYPWAHHAAVAAFSRLTGISPATGFAGLHVVSLAATAIALFAAARAVCGDRNSAVFAAGLALYGLTALPMAALLSTVTSIELETRLIPIQKFTNTNSNPLGFLFFSIGLYALIRLLADVVRRERSALVWLFVAITGAAFFYPLSWAPLVAVATCAAGYAHYRRRDWPRARVLRVAAVIVTATGVALPYLFGIQLGKDPAAAIGLRLDAAHLARNVANLLLVTIGWAVLLWLGGNVAELRRSRPGAFFVLAAAVAIPGLGFVVLHSAVHTEYKLLALCGMTLAIPGGGVVRRIYDYGSGLCFLLLWLMLLPAATFFGQLLDYDYRGASGAVTETGLNLVHGSADERALHEWIRGETPSDAVFVDREWSIAPFAHRQLFVAMASTAAAGGGWGLPAPVLLGEVMGHDPAEIASRQQLTEALLGPAGPTALGRAVGQLRAALHTEHVYVVARDAASSTRLTASLDLRSAFRSGSIAVFKLTPRTGGSP